MPRIVFVARKPYYQILREARHLRRLGYHVTLVTLTPLPEAVRPAFSQAFEQILHLSAGPDEQRELLALLRRLDPDILHVQCGCSTTR